VELNPSVLRVLSIHNTYRQRGGEDAAFGAECALLEEHGHEVIAYRRSNDELNEDGFFGKALAGGGATWSSKSYRQIHALIERVKPDVVHFHNTFPLISPAAYFACAKAGVPVVQTLHNYRLLCPGGNFMRDGRVCQECLGRAVAWPGVVHKCYRGSRGATAATAAMLATHRALGTWQRKVDVYIALTEFARRKFIEGGLPAERIALKPNFVKGDFPSRRGNGEYALFVGRLSEEKGPQLLPEAWKRLAEKIPLRIVGGGPLFERLSNEVKAAGLAGMRTMGRMAPVEVRQEMLGARFLVFPSIWYEGFPMTIAEAYACGLPVIASRLGSMGEIVQDGVTGLHFESGNAFHLAAKVEWAWNHPEELARMGQAARAEFEAKYTTERNYEMLMEIYRSAMARRAQETVVRAAPAAAREN
jgi:glycosyltransferase involved in cell wall biosynthesis